MSESQRRGDAGGVESNQVRLRDLLQEGSLAKRLALDYDESKSAVENSEALKKVVEARLEQVRRGLDEDKNQVD